MSPFDILILVFFATLLFSFVAKTLIDVYIYVIRKLRENKK